ncbi:MAG: hypothetical protein WCK55_18530 [Verrucomicrobiota bacterium]
MPDKSKPQTKKNKPGRGVKPSPLWQLQDPNFEQNHWWMIPDTKFVELMKLNKGHPELTKDIDAQSRPIERAAPIVWEMLRRHPEVARIREELLPFLPGEGRCGMLYSREAKDLFRRLGFELEFLLACSGLNAWASNRAVPDDYDLSKKGARPLDENSKSHFEHLMEAYRHEKRADLQSLLWWTDLTQMARSSAAYLREIAGEKPQAIKGDDPLSIFADDATELKILKAQLKGAKESGMSLTVIVHEQDELWYPAKESAAFDDKDYLMFSPGHFKNFSALVRRLQKHSDGVSLYLWGRLPEHARNQLKRFGGPQDSPFFQSQGLAHTLSNELNEILLGPSIFTEEFFKDVVLPKNTKKLLEKKPRAYHLVRLNRLLLEAAYDSEIIKSNVHSQSSTPRENVARRPNHNQLTCIYDVENGRSLHRQDYHRMLGELEFPLLPCEDDPERKDTIDARLRRVTSGLHKITPPAIELPTRKGRRRSSQKKSKMK